MALKKKLDARVTNLTLAEEDPDQIGVLPITPVWLQMEPNSYGDWGPDVTTVAREVITADRQNLKGFVTAVSADGGFVSDLTQKNLAEAMQGFFFADFRITEEFGGAGEILTVVNATSDYTSVSGLDAYAAGALVFAEGFTNPSNNGVKTVTAAVAATLTVAETLVDEVPPATAKLVEVGVVGSASDIDVDVSGDFPALTSTVLDFTTLPIIPGGWAHIGGDGAGNAFANAENNGFKRVRSITATRLEFDKSILPMSAETGTGLTIQVFFPKVLKNEQDPLLIKRRTYQLERLLGAPDTAAPSDIQAEYLLGAVANTFELSIPTQERVTADLGYIAIDAEDIDAATGPKAGDRPVLAQGDAFNTSKDFKFIRLAPVEAGNEAPDALFGFLQRVQLSINNNASINNAIGSEVGFEVTVGNFMVSGEVDAYFVEVGSRDLIRSSGSASIDFGIVKNNSGIVFDVPLITLAGGRLNVALNEVITIPVTFNAASGAQVHPDLDYTAAMFFFDYLPDLAA